MDDKLNIPNHVAIILDGNGRWAKKRGMPRSYGHMMGARNLEDMCEEVWNLGIKYFTVYLFSTENWKRSDSEVASLMDLFRHYMKTCVKRARANNMKCRVIGEISAFDQDLQDSIIELEEASKDFTGLNFQLAMNYGSRDEITRAVRKLGARCRDGSLDPAAITEEMISAELDTGDIPDPDLLIRTGGDIRISNYLLWQLAYTELYFTDTMWPDFHRDDLVKAIEKFNHTERRFGGVKEE